jgi:hypothetical protein
VDIAVARKLGAAKAGGSGGDSPLVLVLGVAGLALGAIALVVALRRSPRR